MIRRPHNDLRFSMSCPYSDPKTDESCTATITVRAWPGTPGSRDYPGDPPGWDAWGCPHVEGKIDERTEWMIQQTIEEREADAQARAEEAAIGRAEEGR